MPLERINSDMFQGLLPLSKIPNKLTGKNSNNINGVIPLSVPTLDNNGHVYMPDILTEKNCKTLDNHYIGYGPDQIPYIGDDGYLPITIFDTLIDNHPLKNQNINTNIKLTKSYEKNLAYNGIIIQGSGDYIIIGRTLYQYDGYNLKLINNYNSDIIINENIFVINGATPVYYKIIEGKMYQMSSFTTYNYKALYVDKDKVIYRNNTQLILKYISSGLTSIFDNIRTYTSDANVIVKNNLAFVYDKTDGIGYVDIFKINPESVNYIQTISGSSDEFHGLYRAVYYTYGDYYLFISDLINNQINIFKYDGSQFNLINTIYKNAVTYFGYELNNNENIFLYTYMVGTNVHTVISKFNIDTSNLDIIEDIPLGNSSKIIGSKIYITYSSDSNSAIIIDLNIPMPYDPVYLDKNNNIWRKCKQEKPQGIYLGNNIVAVNGNVIDDFYLNGNIYYKNGTLLRKLSQTFSRNCLVGKSVYDGNKYLFKVQIDEYYYPNTLMSKYDEYLNVNFTDDPTTFPQVAIYNDKIVGINNINNFQSFTKDEYLGWYSTIITPSDTSRWSIQTGEFKIINIHNNICIISCYPYNNSQGSVYVFRYNGTTWIQEQILTDSNGAQNDWFGSSMSIYNDVIVVGAYQDDETYTNQGSTCIFRYNGTQWIQEQKLVASDGAQNDMFGISVSIYNDVVAVGACHDDNKGSVYIFRYNGTQWIQEQKLIASDGAQEDLFGYSVAIYNDIVVVGDNYDDNTYSNQGSVYVFRYNGTQWIQEQKLVASDGAQEDLFGNSVAIYNDVIVVGAYMDDSSMGSVYVFKYNGTQWIFKQKIIVTDSRSSNDLFGLFVSIHNNIIVVNKLRTNSEGRKNYIYEVLD